MKTRMLAAAMALAVTAGPALAQDVRGLRAGDFLIGLSGIGVLPTNGGNTSIGGTPNANDAFTAQLDFTYFFNPNVSLNLIAATTKHDVEVRNVPGAGTIDLGSTWVLPPTLTLQYHPLPTSRFSPYVGAGLNYTIFYSEGGSRSPGITSVDIKDSWGFALNAGVNYEISRNWLANFDVKYLFLSPDVRVNGGAVSGTADLNPWVIGVGVRYRF
ncbi:OmpW/AlkL family protein [Falsiroseomonas oryziterrae]|uniref:OmpW/AlkL family protein n=1 Tax=Falsiroseomonas oryziterrae TaxID=2911368 RepID=UPI001F395E4F|nr:OmpW family outer membrane protein [Roseomonas sp. NPKOSM-4]